MSVDAKKILYDIVSSQGVEISAHPLKLKAILRDYHVDKLQANLIIEIAKASYFRAFASKLNCATIEMEKKMLAESVRDDYDFEESYIIWGIECWAQAIFRNNVLANKKKIARYITDAPSQVGSGESALKVNISNRVDPTETIINEKETIFVDLHNKLGDSKEQKKVSIEPEPTASQSTEDEKTIFAKVASITLRDVIAEQEKIRNTLRRAENGDANYRYLLGEMYEQGKGVNPNFRNALKWYKMSAMQGNVQAMRRLGQIYEQGKNIPINYDEAMRWYKAAKDRGDEHSTKRYKILKKRLWGMY